MLIENVWVQILLWIAFISFEQLFAGTISERWSPSLLSYYVFSIALFYSTFFTLLKTNIKNKYYRYLLLLYAFLYVVFCFKWNNTLLYHLNGSSLKFIWIYYGSYVWRSVYFIAISISIYAGYQYVKELRKNSELALQQLKDESEKQLLQEQVALIKNAFLSAQLGRHFLSNILQLALDQVEEVSADAGKTLFRAIDVIDYAISLPEQGGLISLDKELEQVSHLIEIARLRFAGEIFLETVIDTAHEPDIRILPYLLTTFINNVFEHGHLKDAEFPARILISCNQQQLELKTFNKKRSDNWHHGHGIGISNIRARLDNQYGKDAYQIHIDEDARFYNLHFKLKI